MLSLTGKRWIIANESTDGTLFERVLAARGITAERRETLLHPDLARDSHDPMLLPDFAKAIERIMHAIETKERIFVVGDYDVDGVTGSAILFKALHALGANISIRLPHRMIDGYGLNEKMVAEARTLDVKLIITVDNGIAANIAIAKANEFAIDVIVTDHHLPPATLPDAYALVDPRIKDSKYPFKYLAGAGVAWKVATYLLDHASNTDTALRDELLAFATLGTIADMCPLIDENRALVAAGIAALSRTKNPGLLRMYQNTGITPPVTTVDVGFRIGPRLNAAGRLDSALTAFQTLTHPTHAAHFADELEILNTRRRSVGEDIVTAALETIGAVGDEALVIASSEKWHRGVIGLAAGRIAERLHRPVILMEEKDGLLVGSCRCPLPDFNITDALTSVADLLITFGGHRAAAGFTMPIEKRDECITRLQTYAAHELATIERTPSLTLDTHITEQELTLDTIGQCETLAPFGMEHAEPTFALENITLTELRLVGETKKHLSARVGYTHAKVIWFGGSEHIDALANQSVDLAIRLGVNEWQGRKEVSIMIADARARS